MVVAPVYKIINDRVKAPENNTSSVLQIAWRLPHGTAVSMSQEAAKGFKPELLVAQKTHQHRAEGRGGGGRGADSSNQPLFKKKEAKNTPLQRESHDGAWLRYSTPSVSGLLEETHHTGLLPARHLRSLLGLSPTASVSSSGSRLAIGTATVVSTLRLFLQRWNSTFVGLRRL